MLYFKIENHDKTPNQVFNLYTLQYENNSSGRTTKLDDTLVNNVWYPIDDLLLKSTGTPFTKEILFHEMISSSHLKSIASEQVTSNSYSLDYADTYLVENKNQNAKDGRYFDEPIRSSINDKNTGPWVYPFVGQTRTGDTVYSYKFLENTTDDMYLILSVGNPNSSIYNDPLIKWNGISEISYKDKDTTPHRYNQYFDITALPKKDSSTTFIAATDITKPIYCYLNGKLIKTIDSAKKDTELFTTTLNGNDILETKYAKKLDPTPPVEIQPVYYNLPTIEHVTFSPTKAELGKKTTITVAPDTGYTINRLTFFANDENSGERIFTSPYKNGSIILDLTYYDNDDLNLANQTIKHSEDINIKKVDHSDEHKKQVPIQLDLVHATADKNSILENSTDTITLTADNGYIFDDDIVYYSYDINSGVYNKLIEKANKQSSIKIDLTTSSYYVYNISKDNPVTSGGKPYIKAVATSPTVKPTGTKAINLYSMTDGELNTFMNSVLLQFNSTQTSLANFLDFVKQVYRIPLNIPNGLLTPVKQVHSGKWNINVNTNQITQDHFSINFEPIKVTSHYQNANDYNSITVSLIIPFAKEIELNINDVMNNTIKITYNLDLLQGKTTIIVNNDTGTIYTNQIDISTQLEFYGLHYDKTIGGLNSTYINNVLQPYISISYHKPITNLISYSTNENGVLKDYNGFVRVSHGTLMGNMNDTEYNEIMNLLYGGIKIGTKGN